MRQLNVKEIKKVNGGITPLTGPTNRFNDNYRRNMEEFARRILAKLEG